MRTYLAAALLALLVLPACGKSDKQTYQQAVDIVCNSYERADAERFPVAVREQKLAEWLDRKVTNSRARKLLRSAAKRDDEDMAAIRAAADEAELSECPLIYQAASETELPTSRLPVAEGAKVSSDIPLTRVAIDARGISLGGKRVVAIDNWKIAEDDMDGKVIEPLKQALRDNALMVGSVSRIGLLADRDAPFELLVGVITSAKALGMTEQFLIVAGDSELGALEVYLPSPKKKPGGDAGAGEEPAEDARIKLVVTLSRERIKLWSLSGKEGSLDAPRLLLEPVNDKPTYDLPVLTAALVEIAGRRWPDPASRPQETKDIAIMVFGDVPVQAVVNVLVAAGHDAEGNELFPRTLLATSFDAAPPE